MLLACNAWLTDRIRQELRFHIHPFDQLLLEQFLDTVMVEVGKAAVPKRQVQWTGADRACKVSHGHHLTIQEGCIVGVDSCSEEQLSLSSK